MDMITLKDINFGYEEQAIFQKFNLSIKEGTFLTVLGPSGSGKTTLLQLLLGMKQYEGQITIQNELLNEEHKREISSMIGFACSDSS